EILVTKGDIDKSIRRITDRLDFIPKNLHGDPQFYTLQNYLRLWL
ncbi:unnamed protein product, partial [marine sediment metagenome]